MKEKLMANVKKENKEKISMKDRTKSLIAVGITAAIGNAVLVGTVATGSQAINEYNRRTETIMVKKHPWSIRKTKEVYALTGKPVNR